MPHEEKSHYRTLTDLERRAFRSMADEHNSRYPAKELDVLYTAVMARAAVRALTTGSASGRRIKGVERRAAPAPGCTPERIRYLARQIEGSFHSMPNGWVSADDQLGKTYE